MAEKLEQKLKKVKSKKERANLKANEVLKAVKLKKYARN